MLLAHQGGWDEALFVAVPIALFALLLMRAKRNAQAEHDAEVTSGGDRVTGGAGDDQAEPDER